MLLETLFSCSVFEFPVQQASCIDALLFPFTNLQELWGRESKIRRNILAHINVSFNGIILRAKRVGLGYTSLKHYREIY